MFQKRNNQFSLLGIFITIRLRSEKKGSQIIGTLYYTDDKKRNSRKFNVQKFQYIGQIKQVQQKTYFNELKIDRIVDIASLVLEH